MVTDCVDHGSVAFDVYTPGLLRLCLFIFAGFCSFSRLLLPPSLCVSVPPAQGMD